MRLPVPRRLFKRCTSKPNLSCHLLRNSFSSLLYYNHKEPVKKSKEITVSGPTTERIAGSFCFGSWPRCLCHPSKALRSASCRAKPYGCSYKLRVLLVGVLIMRASLCGVYFGTSDFWQLPYEALSASDSCALETSEAWGSQRSMQRWFSWSHRRRYPEQTGVSYVAKQHSRSQEFGT